MGNKVGAGLAVAGLMGSCAVFTGSPPAAATVASVTSAGTVMTVILTGSESIQFACSGGNAGVAKGTLVTLATPAVPCAALTKVVVSGDAGAQSVDGSKLDAAPFTANPFLSVSLGDGGDLLVETRRADTIVMGGGNDSVLLRPGTVTNAVSMGSGTGDGLSISGTDGADTVTVASTSTTATVTAVMGGTTTTWSVTDAEQFAARGGKGNDTLTVAAVGAASSIDRISLRGEDGNDTLTSGPAGVDAYGGTGTNTFNLGTGSDGVSTDSESDTIVGAPDGAADTIIDDSSLRSGGRSISGFGDTTPAFDTLGIDAMEKDTVVRIRPTTVPGNAFVTLSLNRTGQQQVPAGLDTLTYSLGAGSLAMTPKALGDVVAVAQGIYFSPTSTGGDLYDITIPSGGWTLGTDGTLRTIDPDSSAYGPLRFPLSSAYRVHGPWTVKETGFAHRVHRDLLFRFASDALRDQTSTKLKAGTITRSGVVASWMDTDEYRGLDVDRVFRRYLRRNADPSGRTYWINSIEAGKSLPQFRAQLIGSSEYFTKAGSTNAGFVDRVYRDVLGRAPDPSGLAYWTGRADAGLERGLIARRFLDSSEVRRTIVHEQFLRFIDRPPTADETTAWTSVLSTEPTGEQLLVASLAGSSSYYNRT